MSLALFDIIILVIVALSGILALMRGLTREILSVVPWLIAIGASLAWISSETLSVFRDSFANLMSDYIDEQTSLVVSAILVFLISLSVVFTFIVKLSNSILNSQIGAVDRTLGMFFGLSRGFLFVLIGILLFNELFNRTTRDRWTAHSQSYDFLLKSSNLSLQYLGDIVSAIAPEDKQYVLPHANDEAENSKDNVLILPEGKENSERKENSESSDTIELPQDNSPSEIENLNKFDSNTGKSITNKKTIKKFNSKEYLIDYSAKKTNITIIRGNNIKGNRDKS